MEYKLLTALLLTALAPAAVATTWYLNGVTGSNSNNCTSPTTACKTIKHAISLAASGDSIIVASATYIENLTIGKSLTIVGSGASTTIIDGGGVNTVVTISSPSASVTLSKLTIRHGNQRFGDSSEQHRCEQPFWRKLFGRSCNLAWVQSEQRWHVQAQQCWRYE